ncbi:hypothetical protein LSH36_58g08021 [Paralvinella palmiformis]|uniref:Uncharacterized protein n=1 Tax=Paralvinella palmiformis TaxID=53620 RepID=A0AAD9K5L5_9ANNE|nr:hypothetical protein LSH36_58g08021 [Paralvinella palmiformis]
MCNLLIVCFVPVVNTTDHIHSSVILVLLGAFMSYKILLLQTQIDMAIQMLDPSVSGHLHSQKLYNSLYHLNDQYHASTIERFHNILEANIEILNQVHASLFSLHRTSNLSGDHESCPGQDNFCKENS